MLKKTVGTLLMTMLVAGLSLAAGAAEKKPMKPMASPAASASPAAKKTPAKKTPAKKKPTKSKKTK